MTVVRQEQLTEEQFQLVITLMRLDGWSTQTDKAASAYVHDVLGEEAYARWIAPPYAERQAQYWRIWRHFGAALP